MGWGWGRVIFPFSNAVHLSKFLLMKTLTPVSLQCPLLTLGIRILALETGLTAYFRILLSPLLEIRSVYL